MFCQSRIVSHFMLQRNLWGFCNQLSHSGTPSSFPYLRFVCLFCSRQYWTHSLYCHFFLEEDSISFILSFCFVNYRSSSLSLVWSVTFWKRQDFLCLQVISHIINLAVLGSKFSRSVLLLKPLVLRVSWHWFLRVLELPELVLGNFLVTTPMYENSHLPNEQGYFFLQSFVHFCSILLLSIFSTVLSVILVVVSSYLIFFVDD